MTLYQGLVKDKEHCEIYIVTELFLPVYLSSAWTVCRQHQMYLHLSQCWCSLSKRALNFIYCVTANWSTFAGDIFVYIGRQVLIMAKYHCCQIYTDGYDWFLCERYLVKLRLPEVLVILCKLLQCAVLALLLANRRLVMAFGFYYDVFCRQWRTVWLCLFASDMASFQPELCTQCHQICCC